MTFAIIIACVFLFIFYGNKNSNGESALLHLLKRIADERLTDDLLESEMEEIVNQRDGLYDEFGEILKNAKTFEMSGKCDFEEMLDAVLSVKENRFTLDKDYAIEEFLRREEAASTVLSDFVAIPHVISDKVDGLKLIVVRNKDGVEFSRQDKSVKAIFCLIGRFDERDKHLMALSMIARKARDPQFYDEWMEEPLKDILNNW